MALFLFKAIGTRYFVQPGYSTIKTVTIGLRRSPDHVLTVKKVTRDFRDGQEFRMKI
jgi:hypothetical protein